MRRILSLNWPARSGVFGANTRRSIARVSNLSRQRAARRCWASRAALREVQTRLRAERERQGPRGSWASAARTTACMMVSGREEKSMTVGGVSGKCGRINGDHRRVRQPNFISVHRSCWRFPLRSKLRSATAIKSSPFGSLPRIAITARNPAIIPPTPRPPGHSPALLRRFSPNFAACHPPRPFRKQSSP